MARSREMVRPVAGTGLFAGLSFHPLVPSLPPPGGYVVRDFTRGMQEALANTGFTYDVGRYNERRRNMYTSDLFGAGSSDPWCDPGERRDIHIGIDVGGPVGTAVHAVADGVVHSCGYNAAALDYGHVVVVEHVLNGRRVWALLGHLSAASTEGRCAGDAVAAGDVVGWLGAETENGGWPPHVHFQLSLIEPATHDMPGVVGNAQHAQAMRDYPDPRMCLGRLYEGGDEGVIE